MTTGGSTGKASFDRIYDQPDPRAYIRELGQLEYQIPDHGREIFRALVRALREQRGEGWSVADLCCSYGFNAALVNHEVTLGDLYARYRDPRVAAMAFEELARDDRAYFAARRRPDAVPMVGLDVAGNAVAYARRVGILDLAVAEDLEAGDPSEELRGHLAEVGLYTVTGGIGYIGEATFERLLGAAGAGQVPWVAAFTLRWVDMGPVSRVMEKHGLAVERLEGHTFRQRRFADHSERDYVLAELAALGIDPEGSESDGYHHTWLYLARPAREAAATPIEELLAPVLPR